MGTATRVLLRGVVAAISQSDNLEALEPSVRVERTERQVCHNVTPRDPIFILSALARSGTNYLWELLRRHPDCAPARSPVWEDYLLQNAHHLERFAAGTQESWDESWGSTGHLRPKLLEALGDAVITFFSEDEERRLLLKSPSIANLELFFDVFPRGHCLLLIRDGRDVAASGMKTFGWGLEDTAHSWVNSVSRIRRFLTGSGNERATLVRFEDLVLDPEQTLKELFSFLEMDPALFDMASLAQVPVRGSSTDRGAGRSNVNWDVQARPSGFDPVGRWRSWSDSDICAFEAIAGAELERSAYRRHQPGEVDDLQESRFAL